MRSRRGAQLVRGAHPRHRPTATSSRRSSGRRRPAAARRVVGDRALRARQPGRRRGAARLRHRRAGRRRPTPCSCPTAGRPRRRRHGALPGRASRRPGQAARHRRLERPARARACRRSRAAGSRRRTPPASRPSRSATGRGSAPEPTRLATLAYDAVSLARGPRPPDGAQRFAETPLTNPSGFAGADGTFRFRPDGTSERALAVNEIRNGAATIVAPAPRALGPSGT